MDCSKLHVLRYPPGTLNIKARLILKCKIRSNLLRFFGERGISYGFVEQKSPSKDPLSTII